MSWRIRPDDILLEVSRLLGSKTGMLNQKMMNIEVRSYSEDRAVRFMARVGLLETVGAAFGSEYGPRVDR